MAKAKVLHSCNACGSTFTDGNSIYGEPNGIGLVFANGTVNFCSACVRKCAGMSDDERDLFINEAIKNAGFELLESERK